PSCFATGDINFDGAVDVADAIYLLSYLFQSGSPPAAPFPSCGTSGADSDLALGCDQEGC
ncbi:MAG: hypothetical protein KDC38_11485, partial [Planctomycetes bacterium]|nr:hypothetical protein [Planctomycetota bacterium]